MVVSSTSHGLFAPPTFAELNTLFDRHISRSSFIISRSEIFGQPLVLLTVCDQPHGLRFSAHGLRPTSRLFGPHLTVCDPPHGLRFSPHGQRSTLRSPVLTPRSTIRLTAFSPYLMVCNPPQGLRFLPYNLRPTTRPSVLNPQAMIHCTVVCPHLTVGDPFHGLRWLEAKP